MSRIVSRVTRGRNVKIEQCVGEFRHATSINRSLYSAIVRVSSVRMRAELQDMLIRPINLPENGDAPSGINET